jgi:hypothetical protein
MAATRTRSAAAAVRERSLGCGGHSRNLRDDSDAVSCLVLCATPWRQAAHLMTIVNA